MGLSVLICELILSVTAVQHFHYKTQYNSCHLKVGKNISWGCNFKCYSKRAILRVSNFSMFFDTILKCAAIFSLLSPLCKGD